MSGGDLRAALEEAVGELPAGLRDHVLRVVREAQRLARRHGVDEDRATIAALGHDLMRARPPRELLRRAKAAALPLSDLERHEPVLLHGPLSALTMAERFGVEDEEALAAARFHTTARAGMSELERLLFVADKVEPEKVREDQRRSEARRLADESLEVATLLLLDYQVAKAVERGWPLHPDTVAARNELVLRR